MADLIQHVAVSGNGQRMVLGTALGSIKDPLPFQPGGKFSSTGWVG
jgi:hypothetical protein